VTHRPGIKAPFAPPQLPISLPVQVQGQGVPPFQIRFIPQTILTMTYLFKGAIALLLVLTPGMASAIPMPPITPSTNESTTATGGPRRAQVLTPIEGESRPDYADAGGPRRPGALTPGR
jgi:hypothetical protein